MPAAMRLCVVPRCGALVTAGRCRIHAAELERSRPNLRVRQWYRTPAWQARRAEVLRDAAYTCASCGAVTIDMDVDHVVRHEGDRDRFWARENLQALCRACHGAKTRRGE